MSDPVIFVIGCIATGLCLAFVVITLRELRALGMQGDKEVHLPKVRVQKRQ